MATVSITSPTATRTFLRRAAQADVGNGSDHVTVPWIQTEPTLLVVASPTGLSAGDVVRLYVDKGTGAEQMVERPVAPWSARFPVDEGEHTVDAEVRDSGGALLATATGLTDIARGRIYLAVGDSITEGQQVDAGTTVANGRQFHQRSFAWEWRQDIQEWNTGFLNPLASLLYADGIPALVLNFGLGGGRVNDLRSGHFGTGDDGTDEIAARMLAYRATALLLMMGTNDTHDIALGAGSYTLDDWPEFTNRLGLFLDRLAYWGVPRRAVLIANLPKATNTNGYDEGFNLVPYTEALADARGMARGPDFWYGTPPALSGDGIHPNATGYTTMGTAWHGIVALAPAPDYELGAARVRPDLVPLVASDKSVYGVFTDSGCTQQDTALTLTPGQVTWVQRWAKVWGEPGDGFGLFADDSRVTFSLTSGGAAVTELTLDDRGVAVLPFWMAVDLTTDGSPVNATITMTAVEVLV